MPRIKKTSSQPKRKPKKPIKIPDKIYPPFIEDFKKELMIQTPFILRVDEYGQKGFYQIGILQKLGNTHRCIWMANDITGAEDLSLFWKSETYIKWKSDSAR